MGQEAVSQISRLRRAKDRGPVQNALGRFAFGSGGSLRFGRRRRPRDSIRRIKIILSSDPNQGKQGVAPGVG